MNQHCCQFNWLHLYFYKTTMSNYTNATLKHDLGGSLYNYLSKRKLLVSLINFRLEFCLSL